MLLQLGFGNIDDDVIVEFAGRFEVVASAVVACGGSDVMFDERQVRRRFGSGGTGVLAMVRSASIVGRPLPGRLFGCVFFTSLEKLLELVFELGDTVAKLGVFGFEFGQSGVTRVFHNPTD
jgi:hypothetical protein